MKGKRNESEAAKGVAGCDIKSADQKVGEVATGRTPSNATPDDLSIPAFLRREDTPEQREARGELTKRLRALRVIVPSDISPRAVCEADQKVIAELSSGMASFKKAKAAARIAKLLAKKSGDAVAMPLQGKEALKVITQQEEGSMSKVGVKETALREQRANGGKRKTRAEKLADVSVVDLVNAPYGVPVSTPGTEAFGEAMAKLKAEPTPASKASKPKAKEEKVRTKTDKGKSLANARKPVNGNGHSKVEIIAGLLKRKAGCTSKDVLDATGWPAVSMPQQAKAAGLKLRKVKESGEPTRYYGS